MASDRQLLIYLKALKCLHFAIKIKTSSSNNAFKLGSRHVSRHANKFLSHNHVLRWNLMTVIFYIRK